MAPDMRVHPKIVIGRGIIYGRLVYGYYAHARSPLDDDYKILVLPPDI